MIKKILIGIVTPILIIFILILHFEFYTGIKVNHYFIDEISLIQLFKDSLLENGGYIENFGYNHVVIGNISIINKNNFIKTFLLPDLKLKLIDNERVRSDRNFTISSNVDYQIGNFEFNITLLPKVQIDGSIILTYFIESKPFYEYEKEYQEYDELVIFNKDVYHKIKIIK